jgi:hypothetical protein
MVDGQPQHRSGLGETYQAQQPLTGNWVTTEQFDWATGAYTDGYGRDRDKSVTHERTVIFVKPSYLVVLDRLLGTGDHTYSSIFHLDADDAAVDENSLVIRTTQPDAANLAVVPVDRDGLTVRVVKGQEDPVQGWAPMYARHAVPTPIYEKQGPCPQTFVTLLVPYAKGSEPAITAELLDVGAPKQEALGLRVTIGDAADTLLYSFEGPRSMAAGGVRAEARLALVRSRPGAQPSTAAMDGKLVSVGE